MMVPEPRPSFGTEALKHVDIAKVSGSATSTRANAGSAMEDHRCESREAENDLRLTDLSDNIRHGKGLSTWRAQPPGALMARSARLLL
jgi:hypothetical protein